MNSNLQDPVCAFVREILGARTGDVIAISARPEIDHRNIPVVEELWESPTHRYAVEHTRIEAFEGQIANLARVLRLLVPVKQVLGDHLPGYFGLAVRETELAAARIRVNTATLLEVARLVLDGVGRVAVGEAITLESEALPFTMRLNLRHRDSSALILYTDIEGDPEARRLERIRRALDDKCPKLASWSADGRTSVLALESNDIQLSNAFVISDAVLRAVSERGDQPDIIVLVETDGAPMYGRMLKEGEHYGDDVPTPHGDRCYTEGQVPR